ncbi:MAG: twin-arginine translocation signal domain-containing protein [Puniceicoccaceae bacterium]
MSDKDRRKFLKMGALAGAGMVAASSESAAAGHAAKDGTTPIPQDEAPIDASKMPMTRIGHLKVSRLVVGANQMAGYSHRGDLLAKLMMDYYSTPQVVKVLRYCETRGINTWQTSFSSRHQGISTHYEKVVAAWEKLRESGSKMNIVALVTSRDWDNPKAWDTLLKLKPDALIHHGHITDRLWVEGKMDQVHDRLKQFRDTGALVGCSMHDPDCLAWMDDQGWDLDFYLASFYRASKKLRDQWTNLLEHKPLHEMYLEDIPDLMCPAILKTDKPVLAYKILAAGRLTDRKPDIEKAFKYAFQNIKPKDGVIVGMFPKFRDEVTESARLTIQYG